MFLNSTVPPGLTVAVDGDQVEVLLLASIVLSAAKTLTTPTKSKAPAKADTITR